MGPNLEKLTMALVGTPIDRFPDTVADRTKRVYDALSAIYPVSTYCFHSRAHRVAMRMSGIRDGMNVLEVATGSGEMFKRLVRANPSGRTVGVDLSPKMAARTHGIVRREFPDAKTQCKAVDARAMPFRDASFDAIMCCYLLELLGSDDILLALREFRRVLRPGGALTLVTIGQYDPAFNQLYKLAGKIAPAFWGRQVEKRAVELIESTQFRVIDERNVRQGFYPSRVLTARK